MQVFEECCWPEGCGAFAGPGNADFVYAAASSADSNNSATPIKIVTPDSLLWPAHRIKPCDSSSGFISLHHTFVNDSDLFCDAVVMNVAPSFPDLSALGEEPRAGVELLVAEFPALFSSGKDDLGRVNPDSKVSHRIDLKPDASPPT